MNNRVSFSELMKEHQGYISADDYESILIGEIPEKTYNSDKKIDEREILNNFPQLLDYCLNDNLTKTQKCYIMLYYKKGLNVTQIAGLFNVNKSTVSRTINRGKTRLLKAIRCEVLRKSIKK